MQDDGKLYPVSYASRALSRTEENYAITEMEILAVVCAMRHFHHLLYGHRVTVVTDHVAVKAVLATPNPSAKHARWWIKCMVVELRVLTLSIHLARRIVTLRPSPGCPHLPAPVEGTCEDQVQVSVVRSDDIPQLLSAPPADQTPGDFGQEQRKD